MLEDAGTITVPNWATAIAPGPAAALDEANQKLTFETKVISTTSNLAFSSAPAVDAATGALVYAAATDTNGTAIVTVQLIDDGGTLHNGADRSPIHTLTITVESVNDAPQFQPGPTRPSWRTPGWLSFPVGRPLSLPVPRPQPTSWDKHWSF